MAKCLALIAALLSTASAFADEAAWRLWLDPKAMRAPVSQVIRGAQRTELVGGVFGDDELAPFKRAEFDALGIEWDQFVARATANAAEDLKTLKPRYVRNRRGVIEYAALESPRQVMASAVLAPGFREMFRDTLGESVLVVVPSRYSAFVFPALASNYRDYSPMIFAAYRATAFPVSVEVFELSAAGLRTIGIYEER